MTVNWTERSPEVAALLNPSFCGIALYSALDGFTGQGQTGLPFSLAFLVLPLVLHAPSRELLPNSMRTPFHAWVAASPTLRIGFTERVRAVSPSTREALMFLMARGCIALQKDLLIKGATKPRLSADRSGASQDVKEVVQAAALVGRLLARAGQPATIFTTLGIMP